MQFVKSLLFGAFVLVVSASAVAQGHRGERRSFDLEKMTEQLDLTPEQATQLKTIHEEQRAAFAELAKNTPEGQRPDREEMRSLMQASREKMKEVLTPAQQEQLRTQRQNSRRRGDAKSDRRNPKMNEELRNELRAYRTETITPKFVEVRSEFDKKLSAVERTQIATLREAAKVELGENGLKHIGGRAGSPRGEHPRRKADERFKSTSPEMNAETRDAHRSKMQGFKEKYASEIKAVQNIAVSHKSDLEAVRAELDAAKQQWKKDSDAIRAKHMTAEQIAQRKARDAKHAENRGDRGEGDGPRSGKRGQRRDRNVTLSRADRGAFMFLLMDPTQMEVENFEELNTEKLSVFPNPTTDQTTLQYEVRSAGPVRVELIDASGKVIQTLVEGDREAGMQELPVKLPASMGKTGMIRVTDVNGTRTTQVTRG